MLDCLQNPFNVNTAKKELTFTNSLSVGYFTKLSIVIKWSVASVNIAKSWCNAHLALNQCKLIWKSVDIGGGPGTSVCMTNLHNLATVVALSGEDKCLVLLRTFCGEHLHDMLRPQGYIEEQSTDNASHTPPQNCYS